MRDTSVRMVPLDPVLTEFGREELRLKIAGDYQHAGWYREIILRIIRIANQGETSIDTGGK